MPFERCSDAIIRVKVRRIAYLLGRLERGTFQLLTVAGAEGAKRRVGGPGSAPTYFARSTS
jgi:hypothetical protein